MRHYNISFAGAGRVANVLGKALKGAGHNIPLVVSTKRETGKKLANELGANWSDKLEFGDYSDLIIVAVGDNALQKVLAELQCDNKTSIIHTAGSYGLDIFPPTMDKTGVFYPVQTFSGGRKIDFNRQPFLLESNNKATYSVMEELANSLSAVTYKTDAQQRKILHVAAVFACNFTNHMLLSSKKIAAETGLPFNILEPLVRETVAKAFENGPEMSQTGPAIRNDTKTLNMHGDLLSFDPDLKRLYDVVTKSIIDNYKLNS